MFFKDISFFVHRYGVNNELHEKDIKKIQFFHNFKKLFIRANDKYLIFYLNCYEISFQ
jgi:hypothetical protein